MKPKVPTNKESVYAYITEEEKELLRLVAESRDRSVSNLLGQLIRAEIEAALDLGEITRPRKSRKS